MINETKTFELFGYTSDTLTKGSNKKIVRVCDMCNREDNIIFASYNKAKNPNLCKSCSHNTIEYKQKRSMIMSKNEVKEKISNSQKGKSRKTIGNKNGMFKEIPFEICKKYINGMSANDIAKEYECSRPTIITKLKEFGIKIRSTKEAQINALKQKPFIKEKIRKTLKNKYNDPIERKYISARYQHVTIEAWDGFIGRHNKNRDYVLPSEKCIKLNSYFVGSNAHHIMSGVVVYIPKDLHQSIHHNMKNGKNMDEINTLALQYLYGEI